MVKTAHEMREDYSPNKYYIWIENIYFFLQIYKGILSFWKIIKDIFVFLQNKNGTLNFE